MRRVTSSVSGKTPTRARVFGKRNAAAARGAAAALPPPPSIPWQEAWPEVDGAEGRPRIVPRSGTAAILAGLVVGFCLAGLDITRAAVPDPALAPLIGLVAPDGIGTTSALPAMIVLSLFSGARIAAMTLLLSHRLLHGAGWTSHAAYALGGAAAAAAYAGVVMAFGHPPVHGWILDVAAGGGAGFFYRMFAGARPEPAKTSG